MVQLGGRVDGEKVVELEPRALAQLRQARKITDGRVEPDIEILAGRTGNFEAEVGCIARYVPIPQALRKPLVELASDAALHRAAAHPSAQGLFEFAELEEVVFRLAPYGSAAADDGNRVLEVRGRIGGTAVFAGIAVLIGRAADRANSFDVPVR